MLLAHAQRAAGITATKKARRGGAFLVQRGLLQAWASCSTSMPRWGWTTPSKSAIHPSALSARSGMIAW